MKFSFQNSLFILVIVITKPVFSCQSDHTVAVFCSADDKVRTSFKTCAYTLGKNLATQGFGLVTGGSCTGLMKEVVDGYISTSRTLENLYRFIPEALKSYNIGHPDIPDKNLYWTQSMHIRLSSFHQLADIIIILPGGFGTLHELMDFLAHNQYSLPKKSIYIINVDHYWDNLFAQFQVMENAQTLSKSHLSIFSVVDSVEECMKKLVKTQPLTIANTHAIENLYWQHNSVNNNDSSCK